MGTLRHAYTVGGAIAYVRNAKFLESVTWLVRPENIKLSAYARGRGIEPLRTPCVRGGSEISDFRAYVLNGRSLTTVNMLAMKGARPTSEFEPILPTGRGGAPLSFNLACFKWSS